MGAQSVGSLVEYKEKENLNIIRSYAIQHYLMNDVLKRTLYITGFERTLYITGKHSMYYAWGDGCVCVLKYNCECIGSF